MNFSKEWEAVKQVLVACAGGKYRNSEEYTRLVQCERDYR